MGHLKRSPLKDRADMHLSDIMCFMYILYNMKPYELLIVAGTDKELEGMRRVLRERIFQKAEGIRKDPRGMDSKKLDDATYRVRVGDYRIVYNVDDKKRKV